jgi:hypothetical protein
MSCIYIHTYTHTHTHKHTHTHGSGAFAVICAVEILQKQQLCRPRASVPQRIQFRALRRCGRRRKGQLPGAERVHCLRSIADLHAVLARAAFSRALRARAVTPGLTRPSVCHPASHPASHPRSAGGGHTQGPRVALHPAHGLLAH